MRSTEQVGAILAGGCCIGCGACSAVGGAALRPRLNRHGMFEPVLPPDFGEETAAAVLNVCPFSDEGPDEDALARALYPAARVDDRLGRYQQLYAGYVAEGEFRARGSSGGVISWLLSELLRTGKVDAVIHVGSAPPGSDRLFAYRVSSTLEEVLAGAKSRYYPVEMSDVLALVLAKPGRYALVGLPCFIKAARRLARVDAVFRERVVHTVGLVCGHLKSTAFADCFAWQAGIPPGALEFIDFRVKQADRQAHDYAVTLRGAGRETTAPASGFFASGWGLGLFKYEACEYCDDVFAETADIAVGDAWIPAYMQDPGGTSVIVARSDEMLRLVEDARREGRLHLEPSTADVIATSQTAGLRHRREGLRYRLHLARQRGHWKPRKRVPASARGVSLRRRRIYRLREDLRRSSHELWLESVRAGDLRRLTDGLRGLLARYHRAQNPLLLRVLARLWRLIRPPGRSS